MQIAFGVTRIPERFEQCTFAAGDLISDQFTYTDHFVAMIGIGDEIAIVTDDIEHRKTVRRECAYATGRRKNAVARVWITSGNGKLTVNGREGNIYFARPVLQMILNQPFVVADRIEQYDVWCTVKGGGLAGQAGAIRLGISRALLRVSEENRDPLKDSGYLTRDA